MLKDFDNQPYEPSKKPKTSRQIGLNPNYEQISPMDLDATGSIPILEAIQKLTEKMVTDPLTKCYTLAFYEKYKTENFHPVRDNNKIAIIFIDVNNFKEVNDKLGHSTGDEELKKIAQFLKKNFRKGDEVVRIGGDEFIVICHNSDNDKDFEQNLSKKVCSICQSYQGLVKFACGVAVFDEIKDHDLDDTTKRADQMMYQNKAKMK